MTKPNPYEILGLTPDAEEAVVEAAYQSLIKKHHPDQGGESDRFKEIVDAYKTIQENKNRVSNKNHGSNQPPRESESPDSLFSIFDTPIATEEVVGELSDGLVLEGDHLTISITGITQMDISDYVLSPGEPELGKELLVTLHVENTSDYIQKFRPHETRIIGNDGRHYDAQITGLGNSEYDVLNETKPLPTHLTAESRKMEPHTKGDFIAVIEDIPDLTEIHRVVYPFKLFDGNQIDGIVREKTRYVFHIVSKHWAEFRNVAQGQLEELSNDSISAKNPAHTSQSELKTELESDNSSSPHPAVTDEGTDDNTSSQSQASAYDSDQLSEQDLNRLADIVELQPTTNSELQECWGVDSGSAVHQYLEDSISAMYFRNEDGKIVTSEATEDILSDFDY